MNGFEIFLLVLFIIIGLIVLLLSLPLKVQLSYDDKINLTVKYLFLKFNVLPIDTSKKKKEKISEKAPEEEKKEEEKPKEKKPSPILDMVKANGYDGMMIVLSNLGTILSKYGKNILKSIVFSRAEIYIIVGTGESATTAIKFGKACQKVFPLMSFLCSNNVVKSYDISVEPDFLANNSEGEFFFDMNICIRKILNATIAMAVKVLFSVVLKFLKGAKAPKEKEQSPVAENN